MQRLISGLFLLGIGSALFFLSIPFLFNPSIFVSMGLASIMFFTWIILRMLERGNLRVAGATLLLAALIYAATRPLTISIPYLKELAEYVVAYGGNASFGTMLSWFCWKELHSKRGSRAHAGAG